MRRLSSLTHKVREAVLQALLHLWTFILARSPAQGLVEYGLILVLIMVVCVAILATIGNTVSEVWYNRILQGW